MNTVIDTTSNSVVFNGSLDDCMAYCLKQNKSFTDVSYLADLCSFYIVKGN